MKTIYAFVPARAGSERIKNKNIKLLGSKPLIQYTLDQIKNSNYINKTFISTDYDNLEKKLKNDNSVNLIKRPKKISKSNSLDIDWILHTLSKLENDMPDIIVLLRPTSPFRSSEFIDDSIKLFLDQKNFDSARAVKLVKEHPDKMWEEKDNRIVPIAGFKKDGEDLHSMQYKSLRKVFIQTSSIEILNTNSIIKYKKLSGKRVLPIFSDYLNSFSIDYESDFSKAQEILAKIQ